MTRRPVIYLAPMLILHCTVACEEDVPREQKSLFHGYTFMLTQKPKEDGRSGEKNKINVSLGKCPHLDLLLECILKVYNIRCTLSYIHTHTHTHTHVHSSDSQNSICCILFLCELCESSPFHIDFVPHKFYCNILCMKCQCA